MVGSPVHLGSRRPSGAWQGGGESEGHSTDGGVPYALGKQEAKGRPAVSSQILMVPFSQQEGWAQKKRLASPGGSHLGQRRGLSGLPVPSSVGSLDRPAGGAQHLPPTGPRTWQEPLRTQELLGREPCFVNCNPCRNRGPGISGLSPVVCILSPRPALG